MSEILPVFGQAVECIVFSSERINPRKSKAKEMPDIEGDLERLHQRGRSGFGYKRKDLLVNFDDENLGRLTTPDFEYVSRVTTTEDEVHWSREVSFRASSVDSKFFEAFEGDLDTVVVRFREPLEISKLVDRIEDSDAKGAHLDYDMQCRWCELRLDDTPAIVRFEGREMRVSREPGTVMTLSEMVALLGSIPAKM